MQLLKLYIIICYTIIHKSLNVSSICYIIETIHHYEIYHYTYLCQVSSICHVIETIHAYISYHYTYDSTVTSTSCIIELYIILCKLLLRCPVTSCVLPVGVNRWDGRHAVRYWSSVLYI